MSDNRRVTLVDALRGLALLMIVLIHFVEHFDFFKPPEFNFLFSPETDAKVFELTFFFIAGKAYSIFALMFGFSFYIQMHRKEIQGIDFTKTFVWRLTILLIMGMFHSFIYKGDILQIYAVMGLFLVFFYRIKTNKLFYIAVFFTLQLPSIYNFLISFINPELTIISDFGGHFWEEGNNLYANGSFLDVVKYNAWKGRVNVIGWTFGTGRYLQLFSLFLAGFILGRIKFFEKIAEHKSLLKKSAVISFVVGTALYFIMINIPNFIESKSQVNYLTVIVKSQYNLAFTTFILSLFILGYLKSSNNLFFNSLAVYGRMSLTNYLSQPIIGTCLFYGFGFGLYRYLGSTWSLLFGALFFIGQVVFSRFWLSRFYYGPFEWLWRALTYRTFDVKMRIEK